MTSAELQSLSKQIAAQLRAAGVELTMGGEPSYVPLEPVGLEWSVSAIGPTKFDYARRMAVLLQHEHFPNAVPFLSPGKFYPGEPNPRWALHLVWNRDGSPLFARSKPNTPTSLKEIASSLLKKLRIEGRFLRARDPLHPRAEVYVLPLDFQRGRWRTEEWFSDFRLTLLNTEGSAGLRLPLASLPPEVSRRALVLERKGKDFHVFLPPLLQKPFLKLLRALGAVGLGDAFFEGYVPSDETHSWTELSLTPDPGVLEINLPPCSSVAEYARWLDLLENITAECGLCSFKKSSTGLEIGTGGGNHILFGGPTLDRNGLFKNPGWVTSILRYWQHHPSLSYIFTGEYVGAASQAPRPDESARELYDLEMAYQFLERLPAGEDHRGILNETLRHLHTDGSGNTHRSELSFDKFWNVAWGGGGRGLIEFRAIETLPHARWMAAVGLLWQALAAHLLVHPFRRRLVSHGFALHDRYFLPTLLWDDFEVVLRELTRGGIRLPRSAFLEVWEWRFPLLLAHREGGATMQVRKALEGWPLLCETPLEGGTTSRFVDTSMERLEFLVSPKFAEECRVFVQGRELKMEALDHRRHGAGLRYRRSAWYPSLHPGVQPHIPLYIEIEHGTARTLYRMSTEQRTFERATEPPPRRLKKSVQKLRDELLTCDLRL